MGRGFELRWCPSGMSIQGGSLIGTGGILLFQKQSDDNGSADDRTGFSSTDAGQGVFMTARV